MLSRLIFNEWKEKRTSFKCNLNVSEKEEENVNLAPKSSSTELRQRLRWKFERVIGISFRSFMRLSAEMSPNNNGYFISSVITKVLRVNILLSIPTRRGDWGSFGQNYSNVKFDSCVCYSLYVFFLLGSFHPSLNGSLTVAASHSGNGFVCPLFLQSTCNECMDAQKPFELMWVFNFNFTSECWWFGDFRALKQLFCWLKPKRYISHSSH